MHNSHTVPMCHGVLLQNKLFLDWGSGSLDWLFPTFGLLRLSRPDWTGYEATVKGQETNGTSNKKKIRQGFQEVQTNRNFIHRKLKKTETDRNLYFPSLSKRSDERHVRSSCSLSIFIRVTRQCRFIPTCRIIIKSHRIV